MFRPSTGTWFVAGQGSGISFGGAGDVPIPLFNYYGTGRDVLAVFRPSTSQWFVAGQGSGINHFGFGGAGDIPIAGRFRRGRSRRDRCLPAEHGPVVRRRGMRHPTFGGPADIPLEAPYLYRMLNPAGAPAAIGAMRTAAAPAYDFGVSAVGLSVGPAKVTATTASTIVKASPVVAARVLPNQEVPKAGGLQSRP